MNKKLKEGAKELIDNALVAGAISNYKEDTPNNPKGKFNTARLLGQIFASLALIYEITRQLIILVETIKK
jgi:hypothetical protein